MEYMDGNIPVRPGPGLERFTNRPLPRLPTQHQTTLTPGSRPATVQVGSVHSIGQQEVPNGIPANQNVKKVKQDVSVDVQQATVSEETSKKWPTEPRPLKDRSTCASLYAVGDLLSALLPIAFLVLCILAARLHNTPIENNVLGQRVEVAMSLGPTIFPILFAAVASRSLKAAAHYRAEKGTRLGNLELLMSSQTVWGTFESQFLLRRLSVIGAYLLILWALSPLGGQASLRLLHRGSSARVTETEGRYLDTGPVAQFFGTFAQSGDWGQNVYSSVNSIYVASLLTKFETKIGNQDSWGNVKLPRLEYLESSSPPDPDGWLMAKPAKVPEDFVSLIGLPIVGLSQALSSFTMQASYLSLSCPEMRIYNSTVPTWQQHLGNLWNPDYPYHLNASPFMHTISSVPFIDGINGSYNMFLDTNTVVNNIARINAAGGSSLNNAQAHDPALVLRRNLVFGTRIQSSEENTAFTGINNCTLKQVHAEASIACTAPRACDVVKMRRSKSDLRPSHLTPFETEQSAIMFFFNFPAAFGPQDSGLSSPAELFILDPEKSPVRRKSDFVDLSNVRTKSLAARLAVLLNTYYQISLAPAGFVGDLPTNFSLFGPAATGTSVPNYDNKTYFTLAQAPMRTRTMSITVKHVTSIYTCSWIWLSILAASAGILFVVGLLGLILKFRSNVPEMLGYVSSMTYHNPYIELPGDGVGPLDAMERSRAMKNVKVKIADIQPNNRSGRVALVALGGIDGNINPEVCGRIRDLERKRMYS